VLERGERDVLGVFTSIKQDILRVVQTPDPDAATPVSRPKHVTFVEPSTPWESVERDAAWQLHLLQTARSKLVDRLRSYVTDDRTLDPSAVAAIEVLQADILNVTKAVCQLQAQQSGKVTSAFSTPASQPHRSWGAELPVDTPAQPQLRASDSSCGVSPSPAAVSLEQRHEGSKPSPGLATLLRKAAAGKGLPAAPDGDAQSPAADASVLGSGLAFSGDPRSQLARSNGDPRSLGASQGTTSAAGTLLHSDTAAEPQMQPRTLAGRRSPSAAPAPMDAYSRGNEELALSSPAPARALAAAFERLAHSIGHDVQGVDSPPHDRTHMQLSSSSGATSAALPPLEAPATDGRRAHAARAGAIGASTPMRAADTPAPTGSEVRASPAAFAQSPEHTPQLLPATPWTPHPSQAAGVDASAHVGGTPRTISWARTRSLIATAAKLPPSSALSRAKAAELLERAGCVDAVELLDATLSPPRAAGGSVDALGASNPRPTQTEGGEAPLPWEATAAPGLAATPPSAQTRAEQEEGCEQTQGIPEAPAASMASLPSTGTAAGSAHVVRPTHEFVPAQEASPSVGVAGRASERQASDLDRSFERAASAAHALSSLVGVLDAALAARSAEGDAMRGVAAAHPTATAAAAHSGATQQRYAASLRAAAGVHAATAPTSLHHAVPPAAEGALRGAGTAPASPHRRAISFDDADTLSPVSPREAHPRAGAAADRGLDIYNDRAGALRADAAASHDALSLSASLPAGWTADFVRPAAAGSSVAGAADTSTSFSVSTGSTSSVQHSPTPDSSCASSPLQSAGLASPEGSAFGGSNGAPAARFHASPHAMPEQGAGGNVSAVSAASSCFQAEAGEGQEAWRQMHSSLEDRKPQHQLHDSVSQPAAVMVALQASVPLAAGTPSCAAAGAGGVSTPHQAPTAAASVVRRLFQDSGSPPQASAFERSLSTSLAPPMPSTPPGPSTASQSAHPSGGARTPVQALLPALPRSSSGSAKRPQATLRSVLATVGASENARNATATGGARQKVGSPSARLMSPTGARRGRSAAPTPPHASSTPQSHARPGSAVARILASARAVESTEASESRTSPAAPAAATAAPAPAAPRDVQTAGTATPPGKVAPAAATAASAGDGGAWGSPIGQVASPFEDTRPPASARSRLLESPRSDVAAASRSASTASRRSPTFLSSPQQDDTRGMQSADGGSGVSATPEPALHPGTGLHGPAAQTSVGGFRWEVPAATARAGAPSAAAAPPASRIPLPSPRLRLAPLSRGSPRKHCSVLSAADPDAATHAAHSAAFTEAAGLESSPAVVSSAPLYDPARYSGGSPAIARAAAAAAECIPGALPAGSPAKLPRVQPSPQRAAAVAEAVRQVARMEAKVSRRMPAGARSKPVGSPLASAAPLGAAAPPALPAQVVHSTAALGGERGACRAGAGGASSLSCSAVGAPASVARGAGAEAPRSPSPTGPRMRLSPLPARASGAAPLSSLDALPCDARHLGSGCEAAASPASGAGGAPSLRPLSGVTTAGVLAPAVQLGSLLVGRRVPYGTVEAAAVAAEPHWPIIERRQPLLHHSPAGGASAVARLLRSPPSPAPARGFDHSAENALPGEPSLPDGLRLAGSPPTATGIASAQKRRRAVAVLSPQPLPRTPASAPRW